MGWLMMMNMMVCIISRMSQKSIRKSYNNKVTSLDWWILGMIKINRKRKRNNKSSSNKKKQEIIIIINLQMHTKTFPSNNNNSNSNSNNKYHNTIMIDNNNNSLTSNLWSWLISISSNNWKKKIKLNMLKKFIMIKRMMIRMTRYPLMKSNGNYNRFSINVEIITITII